MRVFVLILIFLFVQVNNSAYCQTDSLKIKELVDKLSWNNIAMDCMGGMLVLTHEDSIENKLYEIGPSTTNALLTALEIPEKTVIAHIILSRLYEDTLFLGLSGTVYIYKDCKKIIGWHNIFNGIVWEWYEDKKDQIDKKKIDKIKQYWTDKVIHKKHTLKFDDSKIFKELELNDSLKYPCIEKTIKKRIVKRNA